MRRIWTVMLAAMMAAFVLAGCGNGGSPAPADTNTGAQTDADTAGRENAAAAANAAANTGGATAESVAERFAAAEGAYESLGSIDDIKDAEVTIGCSWMNLTTEYASNLSKLMDAEVAANYPNVKLIHMDAASDASKQCSQVENLISQGVDAIVMDPFDRNGCAPATEACAAAGIPMIELCQETGATEARTSFVGSIHYESGQILMEALAERAGGSGRVVLLEGPIGQDSSLDRQTAAYDVLKNYPDIEVVADRVCNWERAEAMSTIENIIQSGEDFNIIYAASDSMALGAMEALRGTALEGQVIVGGIDMISDAFDSITGGGMYCTAMQNAPAQAVGGLEVAVRAALGEEVAKEYLVPFEIVTAENAEEYRPILEAIRAAQ